MLTETTSRVVLVTGGASGIGRAVVAAFVAQGDTVVVLDRDTAGEYPEDVIEVVGDVRSPGDNARAAATALEQYGRLDVLVGNAGVHDGGVQLRDTGADELLAIARAVYDVDVVGYMLGAHAAAEPLRASGGCMVFTLSDAAFVAQGNGAGLAYSMAKHAAYGLVRHLAADLAPEVRVNAVAPGGVITGLRTTGADGAVGQEVFDDPGAVEEATRSLNPLGVMLSPEQIAESYTFLASAAAAGMTGHVLRPDGGLEVR